MPFFGITAAIATAVVGIGSFLGSGTLLAKIAMAGLSMAANYALQKFTSPKSPPAQAAQIETRYGEKLARDIIQGTVGTAGHHIYRNGYGRGNHIVQDLYVLSHWNIAGITRVRFKGEWKTLGGAVDPERGQRIQGIDAEIWVKVYTGTMDQVADAGLVAHSNPPGRWMAAHRGAGVAYAVVTNVLTRDHLPNPWEAFFEVQGVTYDWRKDSSVGGEGPHRYAEPETWEPTTNPVLMAYCATRGFFRGTEKIAGKGRSASSLPLADWTLAANICDETVAGKARYQAACILSSGEGATHDANLRPLMEACAASWLELVGQEYPIVGANQTPVTSFTDDDIILDEPFRFAAKRTRTELVNTVAGTYVDPESFYQAMPLATRTDAVALAQDRERLAVPLTFSAVTEPACADRLADIALRASRYQASADLCLRPKYLALKPGQWVTWTSARYGWTKVFQVMGKRLGAFGPKSARAVFISLQEVGDGIFDPTAYATTPPGGFPQGAPDFLSELQDLIVAGITVKDEESGKQYPAIRAAWTPIDDPTVIGVDFRYRLKAQPDILLSHPTVPDDASLTTIVNGVVSATLFEVSHRLLTSPYRQTPWTAWVEVLTPNSPQTDIVYPPGLVDEIVGQVGGIVDFANAGTREHVERIRQLAELGAESASQDHLVQRVIRNEVSLQIGETRAYVSEQIYLAVGPDSAIVARLDEQQAEYQGGLAAATTLITTEVSRIDGVLVAEGNRLDELVTEVEGTESRFLMRAEVTASPGGGTSRWIVQVQSGEPGEYVSSSLLLDVDSGGIGSAGFITNRFFVIDPNDPTTKVAPLVFEGSTLYLGGGIKARWAQIEEVSISSAQIQNGAITSAKIGDAQITSAKIGFLEVDEGNIAANAITSSANDARSIGSTASGSWYTLAEATVVSSSGKPVLIYNTAYGSLVQDQQGLGSLSYRILRNSSVVGIPLNVLSMDAVPGAGTYTYRVEGRRDAGISASLGGSLILQCNKK